VQITTPTATLPSSPTASPIGSSLSTTGAPAEAGDAQLAKAPDMGGDKVGKIGDGLTLSRPDADGRAQLTVQHPDGSVVQYPVDLGAMNSGNANGQGVSGANGTTTVHDGSTTITLHRPAAGGPITVTVDDGAGGSPQNYSVDFDDQAPSSAGDPTLASKQPDTLGHSSAGASMALGGSGSGTSADGSAGAGLGHVGTGGQPSGSPAPKPQPGSFTGVGESAQMPAAAAAGAAGGVAGGAAAGGGVGGGMMPMMGGMGGGAGRDNERQGGGRYNTAEDFFAEDTSTYAKIADMLEPELPE
jgi:hypothetical protein